MLIYSFIFLESVKFIVFFLVCFYYFASATDLLPNKRLWGIGLKIGLVIGVAIEVAGLIILCVTQGLATNPSAKLCMDPVFLVLRAGGELITFFFAVIGITITWKVLTFQRKTIFEKTEQLRDQLTAVKYLW